MLTRMSLPRRSNVRSSPSLGRESKARTLSKRAALGPCKGSLCEPVPVPAAAAAGADITECLIVTPPCADEVMTGTG